MKTTKRVLVKSHLTDVDNLIVRLMREIQLLKAENDYMGAENRLAFHRAIDAMECVDQIEYGIEKGHYKTMNEILAEVKKYRKRRNSVYRLNAAIVRAENARVDTLREV